MKKEDEDEFILPELIHGQYVELEGYVTKGNENTNNIGFQFSGHIINCKPKEGSIVRYKNQLFLQCLIKGFVDREDKNKNIKKRPEIIFTDLEYISKNPSNTKELFD